VLYHNTTAILRLRLGLPTATTNQHPPDGRQRSAPACVCCLRQPSMSHTKTPRQQHGRMQLLLSFRQQVHPKSAPTTARLELGEHGEAEDGARLWWWRRWWWWRRLLWGRWRLGTALQRETGCTPSHQKMQLLLESARTCMTRGTKMQHAISAVQCMPRVGAAAALCKHAVATSKEQLGT